MFQLTKNDEGFRSEKIPTNLLGWYIERDCSEVYLAVSVNAWNYKENSRATSSSFNQSPQTEDDSSFIFLDNLKGDNRIV